ncbi:SH3 domain-containing protein [Paeniglutamicibacter cryotolerans]|uniref:SH3 domain-containing protein n=1 Tax=Paeniglutamicibacter cryotolerans TaxID=670079 RepID=A0A839QGR7_9MICC|nr:SH3 domain-containing protein [Paeniglutamicibacter cryotolerans]MBB2993914.1 hypothetical protein [Paeniglutamicibacter cryotolerans]
MRRPLAAILVASLLAFLGPAPVQAAPAALSVTAPVASTATIAARPPVLYQSTKIQPLHASASTKSTRLTTVKKASYVALKELKGSWVRVTYKGRAGWLPLSSAKKLAQTRYEAKAKLTLRATPGRGKTITVLAKGSTGYATGRKSGRYIQLYRTGKTGWTAASLVQRPVTAKYQTNRPTPFYASASATVKSAAIPADYTLATRTNAKSSGRIQLEYKGKTGWVAAKGLSAVALSVKVGKLSFAKSAAKNIRKWCKGVPISAGPNNGNYATASGYTGKMKESITLGTAGLFSKKLDPNHPMAIAVQYHECAHILQFRAYKYDFTKLDQRMNVVYGKPRKAAGIEHMADCMADVMGAKRTGTDYDPKTGYTNSWTAGYGGKCTATHLKKAKQIIAGKMV